MGMRIETQHAGRNETAIPDRRGRGWGGWKVRSRALHTGGGPFSWKVEGNRPRILISRFHAIRHSITARLIELDR